MRLSSTPALRDRRHHRRGRPVDLLLGGARGRRLRHHPEPHERLVGSGEDLAGPLDAEGGDDRVVGRTRLRPPRQGNQGGQCGRGQQQGDLPRGFHALLLCRRQYSGGESAAAARAGAGGGGTASLRERVPRDVAVELGLAGRQAGPGAGRQGDGRLRAEDLRRDRELLLPASRCRTRSGSPGRTLRASVGSSCAAIGIFCPSSKR